MLKTWESCVGIGNISCEVCLAVSGINKLLFQLKNNRTVFNTAIKVLEGKPEENWGQDNGHWWGKAYLPLPNLLKNIISYSEVMPRQSFQIRSFSPRQVLYKGAQEKMNIFGLLVPLFKGHLILSGNFGFWFWSLGNYLRVGKFRQCNSCFKIEILNVKYQGVVWMSILIMSNPYERVSMAKLLWNTIPNTRMAE